MVLMEEERGSKISYERREEGKGAGRGGEEEEEEEEEGE